MADTQSNNSKIHTIYIVIIIILLVVIAGGFYYFSKQTERLENAKKNEAFEMKGARGDMGRMQGMSMQEATPPAMTTQQQDELTAGTDTSKTQKTFHITAGNFYFVPKDITVNKGDKVTFKVMDAGGIHDLVIDELGVKTEMLMTGKSATATFTASKSGSFVYYCSVPGHRQKGMWGTLTVK